MSLPGELVSIGGIRCYVHRQGASSPGTDPVIVLHGLLFSHWSMRELIGALARAGHEVIAFDLPGFGESDRPRPVEYHYDGEAFMRTLLGVMNALDIERARLVGHGLGGGIALMAAGLHPDRVSRLGLLAPVCYRSLQSTRRKLLRIPIVGPTLLRGALTRKSFQKTLHDKFYADLELPDAATADFVWERLHRPGGVEAFHATWRFFTDPEEVERSIAAVRAPTLVLWGRDDALLPYHWGKRLAQSIPGAWSHLIDGAGHALVQERPTETLDQLVPFITARRPSSLGR